MSRILRPLDFQPLPTGRFRTGMFDIPWEFKAGVESRPQHYRRMSRAEIMQMNPVRIIHEEGGHLLLWCYGPFTQMMFDAVASWSRLHGRRIVFSTRYLAWVKLIERHPGVDAAPILATDVHHGLGLVSQKNLEDLWVFKVGRAPRLKARGQRELLVSPVREHSRKPDEAFDRARLTFRGPYVECFSREPRAHWSTWGDESHYFVEPERRRFVVREIAVAGTNEETMQDVIAKG